MSSGQFLSPRLFEPYVLDDEVDEDPPPVTDVTRLAKLIERWRSSSDPVVVRCADELQQALTLGSDEC